MIRLPTVSGVARVSTTLVLPGTMLAAFTTTGTPPLVTTKLPAKGGFALSSTLLNCTVTAVPVADAIATTAGATKSTACTFGVATVLPLPAASVATDAATDAVTLPCSAATGVCS